MSSVVLDFLTGARPVSDAVDTVTIETKWTPPITIHHPLASNGSAPNPVLAFFKPRITVTSPLRNGPYVATPWGDPGQNYWPEVKIALTAVAMIAAGIIAWKVVK